MPFYLFSIVINVFFITLVRTTIADETITASEEESDSGTDSDDEMVNPFEDTE